MSEAREFNAGRLFLASSLALFTAGLSFSLRAAIASGIEADILVQVDPAQSARLGGRCAV